LGSTTKSKHDKSGKDDTKKTSATPSSPKKDKKDSDVKAKDEKGASPDKPNEHAVEWTKRQDATLTGMKTAGKTWKEISDALGRSKSTLTSRWKELQAESGGGANTGDKKNDDKKDGKRDADSPAKGDGNDKGKDGKDGGANGKGKNDNVTANTDQQKQKNQKKATFAHGQPTLPASVISVSSMASDRTEPTFTLSALIALLEEDQKFFSPGELRDLTRLVRRDDKEKWLRVASRFFDDTGRRVHEDDVRDKVRALNRAGARR